MPPKPNSSGEELTPNNCEHEDPEKCRCVDKETGIPFFTKGWSNKVEIACRMSLRKNADRKNRIYLSSLTNS